MVSFYKITVFCQQNINVTLRTCISQMWLRFDDDPVNFIFCKGSYEPWKPLEKPWNFFY